MLGPFASIEDVPSRYQFVHVVSRRARKIQGGSRPLMPVTSRKPTRVAQAEAMNGLLDFTFAEGTPWGPPVPDSTAAEQPEE